MGHEARIRGMNSNGHSAPVPFAAGRPVPIIGEPVQVESVTLVATLTVRCRCATSSNEPLVLDGTEHVRCQQCGKGYRVILQWQPGQSPAFGIDVALPTTDAQAPDADRPVVSDVDTPPVTDLTAAGSRT
jgi:hypothetical protein